MTTAFTYNEDQAAAADGGGSDYLLESCVVRGTITAARWTMANNSRSEFLQFDFETENGKKANYINLIFRDRNGQPLQFGEERIHALMGCTGVQSLTRVQNGQEVTCPELAGRKVALALEIRYFAKSGSDKPGFGFDVKAIMSAKSGITIGEHKAGKGPESKEYWSAQFAANPHGNKAEVESKSAQGGGQYGGYAADPYQGAGHLPPANDGDSFDDEIPF
ncbi:hypothetical protein [Halomonas litopenaei]|uniref:hypothetical protein n=1 Tax=Halomonas litopenaei TaxID=2109328 RepID=UPI003FA033F1